MKKNNICIHANSIIVNSKDVRSSLGELVKKLDFIGAKYKKRVFKGKISFIHIYLVNTNRKPNFESNIVKLFKEDIKRISYLKF